MNSKNIVFKKNKKELINLNNKIINFIIRKNVFFTVF